MKRRVLVVDDDELILEILRTILDLEEFDVVTAADGAAAIEVVRARPPDVVVLDVMMPGTDGFEVCRAIKGDPASANVPVVLLTALDREEDRTAGKEAGCDAFLTKPFSPLALIDTLNGLGVHKGR